MEDLILEQENEARQWLSKKFDGWYNTYCTQLTKGVPTRMFIADTQQNRMFSYFFRDYIMQRSEAEGWQYDDSKFNITYTDKKDATKSALLLKETGSQAQKIVDGVYLLRPAGRNEKSDIGFKTDDEGNLKNLLDDQETEATLINLGKYLRGD